MNRSMTTLSALAFLGIIGVSECHGQSAVNSVMTTTAAPNFYAAPGSYGTTYGSASYKVPRRYSNFPSIRGADYGLGYGPSGFVANRYGSGLWRPNAVNGPGSGASPYSTFTIAPGPGVVLPPFGYYAPTFGPGPNLSTR